MCPMQLSVKLGLVPVQPSALSNQLFCAFQRYWIRAHAPLASLCCFEAHYSQRFKTMFNKFLRLWCCRVYWDLAARLTSIRSEFLQCTFHQARYKRGTICDVCISNGNPIWFNKIANSTNSNMCLVSLTCNAGSRLPRWVLIENSVSQAS